MNKQGNKTEFARTVTDIVRDQKPDMFNCVPKRIVSKSEAEKMGWKHYWDGETACSQGHVAARFVSNTAICIDCRRLADGKPAIYPTADKIDDLTGAVTFVAQVADERYHWTDERKRQFLASWINTTSIPKALAVVKAQYTHLITLLKTDVVFKAEFESAEQEVSLVQQWQLEGDASDGNDRIRLKMGENKFASFGAKTGLAGRPTVNSEDARAELAQLLLSVERTIVGQERLQAIATAAQRVEPRTEGPAAGPSAKVEKPAVLAPPHDVSDLVSDPGDSSGVSEADAPLCGGIEL